MFCHVDNFDSAKLVIFGLIQIWECALNWFTMELVHKPKLDICHLCGLGALYPKHVFGWSLHANDSQLIWKFAWHSNVANSKHLLLNNLVGHVLVGVNPCGRCAVVALLPQIAKIPKKSKYDSFKKSWADLRRYIAPLLKEGNILSYGGALSGGSIKNQPQFNF